MISDNHEVIMRIANHKRVKKYICDDFNQELVIDSQSKYLVFDDKGFVSISPINHICYNMHVALMPELWGQAREIGTSAIKFIFTNTVCQKLVAFIPAYNRLTIKLVKDCGAKREGIIKESFSKGFKLHDQIIYGLSKAEV
ncbi:GNAT family N-acetyltransferase [Candidatus Pacearchaeota archaeon]|nr:GNAT family N-acetyltransferase [Candidatus Pacearchaeota archaeon]